MSNEQFAFDDWGSSDTRKIRKKERQRTSKKELLVKALMMFGTIFYSLTIIMGFCGIDLPLFVSLIFMAQVALGAFVYANDHDWSKANPVHKQDEQKKIDFTRFPYKDEDREFFERTNRLATVDLTQEAMKEVEATIRQTSKSNFEHDQSYPERMLTRRNGHYDFDIGPSFPTSLFHGDPCTVDNCEKCYENYLNDTPPWDRGVGPSFPRVTYEEHKAELEDIKRFVESNDCNCAECNTPDSVYNDYDESEFDGMHPWDKAYHSMYKALRKNPETFSVENASEFARQWANEHHDW